MSAAGRLLVLVVALGSGGCLRLEGPPPYTDDGEGCESDSQCAPTSACEYDPAVSAYVCRVRGGCTGHADCPTDLACVFGSCTAAECTSDATCGAYACNQTLRQCFDSCASSTQCGSGRVCRDGECLSSTCTSSSAAQVCDGAACDAGVCMSAIDCDTYGCAAGYQCDGINCVRPCTSNAECERYACYTAFGECYENCYLDTDCQPGFECKDNFCQVP